MPIVAQSSETLVVFPGLYRISLLLCQYCYRGQTYDSTHTVVTKQYGTGQLYRIMCGKGRLDLNRTPAILNLTVVCLRLSQQITKSCLDQTTITIDFKLSPCSECSMRSAGSLCVMRLTSMCLFVQINRIVATALRTSHVNFTHVLCSFFS